MHRVKVSMRPFIAALLLSTCLGFQAAAQISTATITGTVTDPTGSAVAGVKIRVVETSMNFESRSETNADGIFRIQSLQPGTYDVTFEAPGFKRLAQTGLLLKVGGCHAG